MENRTNNAGIFIFMILFGISVIAIFGLIGMISAYILMTSYMDNFVLKPLAKSMSSKNFVPNNYMYRKLKTIRLVAWIIAVIFGLPLIFVIEMIALMISVAKINEMRKKMGAPITPFSKYDYMTYEEFWKFSEDDEYNEYESEEDDDYTQRNEYSYEDVIDNQDVKVNVIEEYKIEKNSFNNINVVHENIEEIKKVEEVKNIVKPEEKEDKEEKLKKEIEAIKNELYKTISKEPVLKETQKFDFDKPVGDMPKVEPIKSGTSSLWNEPVRTNSNVFNTSTTENSDPGTDEIRCEKCGTVMSKMKIACPKCGTIVKNTYRTGK